jgi:hypothetical protein
MPRIAHLFPGALVAALLLAACGSSSPKTGTQDPTAAANSADVAFSNCVRTHGVPNFPDLTGGSGGGLRIQQNQTSGSGSSMTVNGVPVSAPAFQAAQRVCQKYLPKPKPVTATQVSNIRAAALKMAQCMRTHGVPNFPDPTVQTSPGGGIGIRITGAGSGFNPNTPAFQKAQTECGGILKAAGGPSGPP